LGGDEVVEEMEGEEVDEDVAHLPGVAWLAGGATREK
jgi:hypothetical protein